MSQEPINQPDELWLRLVEAHHAYAEAFRQLWTDKERRVARIKHGIKHDTALAMQLISFLSPEERILLFDELLKLALLSYGFGASARDAIISMPREWVLDKIQLAVEPYLQEQAYDIYRAVLQLYTALDHSLAYRFAVQITQHADPDIQEAGEDFLEHLSSMNKPG